MGRKTKKQQARSKAKPAADPRVAELKEQGYGNPVRHPDNQVRTPKHPSRSQFPNSAKVGVRLDQPRKSAQASDQAMAFLEGLRNMTEGLQKRAKAPNNQEELAASAARLKALNDFLRKPPVKIIDQLEALGITVQRHKNVPNDSRYDTVVIRVSEIEAADELIKRRGTLYDQLYRGETP